QNAAGVVHAGGVSRDANPTGDDSTDPVGYIGGVSDNASAVPAHARDGAGVVYRDGVSNDAFHSTREGAGVVYRGGVSRDANKPTRDGAGVVHVDCGEGR